MLSHAALLAMDRDEKGWTGTDRDEKGHGWTGMDSDRVGQGWKEIE